MTSLARTVRIRIAQVLRDTRLSLGWSQRELARRARVSQSTICRLELGQIDRLTIETATKVMNALGIRVFLDLKAPFVAKDQRQHDAGHARAVSYVAKRLRRAGWLVRTLVEIVSGSAHGWVDVMAYRTADRVLLIIEVKTELVDIGAVMRQLAWYEREASSLANRFGWRPSRRLGGLFVLASSPNIQRLHDHRDLLRPTFPGRVRDLAQLVAAPAGNASERAIALIDPLERGGRWLLPSPLDSRTTSPRYSGYADFVGHLMVHRATRPAAQEPSRAVRCAGRINCIKRARATAAR